MRKLRHWQRAAIWLGLIVGTVQLSGAYSVLTHEQIVDLVWRDNIVPLLKARFPAATDEELQKAHAYAYGGSLVQDMGYYPFGNAFFSDLTHYVRSGDFIMYLLIESSDLNEYAFALGALSHYSADNCGHPTINKVTAIEFPKLRQKFGDEVTYEEDPKAHIQTEFGFDMVQVAKNRYTSDRYHDFIGFAISKPLLERAFVDTYDVPLTSIIKNEDLAIGTFRRAISQVIPEMTRVALLARKKAMVAETPNYNFRKFRYYLSRTNYQKQWGKEYRRPGFGARVLAFLFRFVPKKGPFRALNFKIPQKQSEDMYIASVNKTVENYKHLLAEEHERKLHLPDTDFDTGKPTRAGEYGLTDKAYARLLNMLAETNFETLTPGMQANMLAFYGNPTAPNKVKRNPQEWAKTEQEVQKLREVSLPTVPLRIEVIPASESR